MQVLRDPLEYFTVQAPERVVSLVPSTTGSLMDLGLGSRLAGVTDYCPDGVSAPRIGGTKTPRVEEIIALKPDLVLANQEENSKEAVEQLCAAGIPVWLSFPNSVKEALADLWTIARLFRSEQAMDMARSLEVGVEWAELAVQDQAGLPYFCPIWQDRLETGERWWMTFNAETYSHDVLRLLGGQNVFAKRRRRYPIKAELGFAAMDAPDERDTRYPRVGRTEILDSQPEIILLPNEPFAYESRHIDEICELLAETPAVRAGRVYTLDGSLITWPGTRLARALAELPEFF